MDDRIDEDEGGESACYANLLCPECGIVRDGSQHAPNCTWVELETVSELAKNTEPLI